MQMEEGLDSGPVLHRVATPIGAGETAGALTATAGRARRRRRWSRRSRSSPAGSTCPSRRTSAGDLCAEDRPGDGAPRLEPGRRRLLERQIRAFDPAPGAWTTLDGGAGEAVRCAPAVGSGGAGDRPDGGGPAGDRRRRRGAIAVREVQPAGRKRLACERLGARPRRRGRAADSSEALAPAARRHRRGRDRGRRFPASARPRSPRPGRRWRSMRAIASAGGAALARVARRLLALARPPEAAVVVNGRPDVAAGARRAGRPARRRRPRGRARRGACFPTAGSGARCTPQRRRSEAARDGADYLLVGNIYETSSHPGRPGRVSVWFATPRALGLPVIAIGGMDAARAPRCGRRAPTVWRRSRHCGARRIRRRRRWRCWRHGVKAYDVRWP